MHKQKTWVQSYVDKSLKTSSSSSSSLTSLIAKEDDANNFAAIPSDATINHTDVTNEHQNQQKIETLNDTSFINIEHNNSSRDGGGGTTSGNASSAEECEGLETCASSDIEVLSLPSNSGDQILVNKLSTTTPQSTLNSKANSVSEANVLAFSQQNKIGE